MKKWKVLKRLPRGTVVANLESKKKISGEALLYAVGRQGKMWMSSICLRPALKRTAEDAFQSIPSITPKQPHMLRCWRCDRISRAWLRYPWSRAVLPQRTAFGSARESSNPANLSLWHLHHSRRFLLSAKRKNSSPMRMVPYEVGDCLLS